MWIFCPQMMLYDIPGLWIFVHNSRIGVKRGNIRKVTSSSKLQILITYRAISVRVTETVTLAATPTVILIVPQPR